MYEVIDITIDSSKIIDMKINVNNCVAIKYSYVPKIKYNKAMRTLTLNNFIYTDLERIGETTIEYYVREVKK